MHIAVGNLALHRISLQN